MHRIALVLGVLVGVVTLCTPAAAQNRESEVTGPKITIRVLGLKKKNAEELDNRLKSFAARGEFKANLKKKGLTFCLKSKAQVSYSELKSAVEGDDKTFRLVFTTIRLIGKMNLALDDSVLGSLQGRKRWQLAKQLRTIKGVSGLRPTQDGTLDLTVAAPGTPLAKIDAPIAAAAKLDKGKSSVTDATWYGPAEGGEKKGSGRKGKRKKGGSKKKGDGDGEGDED